MMEEQEIYKEAIKKWGKEAQLIQMIEESSELQQVLCKSFRYGLNSVFLNFVEELVDVQIMLNELKLIGRDTSFNFDSEFEIQFDKKLRLLEERLMCPKK